MCVTDVTFHNSIIITMIFFKVADRNSTLATAYKISTVVYCSLYAEFVKT